jgi:hypothetical protein
MDSQPYRPLVCVHSEAWPGNNAHGGYRSGHGVSPYEIMGQYRVLTGTWGGASIVRGSRNWCTCSNIEWQFPPEERQGVALNLGPNGQVCFPVLFCLHRHRDNPCLM